MKNQQGFIKLLLIIVLAILVLSYFNFDIKSLVEAPQTQKNFSYTKNAVVYVWDNLLSKPAHFLWKEVWVELLWNNFVHNLKRVDEGAPTDLQEMGQGALDAINRASK